MFAQPMTFPVGSFPRLSKPVRVALAAVTLVTSWAMLVPSLTEAAAAKAPRAPLKVYISVDMEGIAGVVTADQLGPGGFE